VDSVIAAMRENPHIDIEDYDPAADLMAINMGPQHPSTHGVLRIKLFLDGEIIIKAVPYPGYLHRGVEKLCEKLTFVQLTPIFNKHDYVSPLINEQALVMAIEKLAGVEVPRRARYIRTILAEIQRVGSHLLWLPTFTLDMGGVIGGGACTMMYTFRERELIFDIFEALTGLRFHYNTHCVGGQRHDLPAGWTDKVKKWLDVQERMVSEYEALVDTDIFRRRTQGIGVMSQELALSLGQTGPNLRASGVDHDLRRDAPYHCYDEIEVNVPTSTVGDCYARYEVRMDEIRESLRIVRELIDGVPEGPIMTGKSVRLPGAIKAKGGQVYLGVEGPRGEIGTYVIGGGESRGAAAYRLKVRPPCLHAVSALPYLLPGHTISDVVAILGSLDPIMGEVDR